MSQFDANKPSTEGESLYYTLEVTTSMTRLGPAVVERCVQIGVVRPGSSEDREARFSSQDVARLRKVRRLIQEIGLNWAGVEVVMSLTGQLEQLQAELDRLRQLKLK